jgi:hypothetical protein
MEVLAERLDGDLSDAGDAGSRLHQASHELLLVVGEARLYEDDVHSLNRV